jgi:hypothetical protein
MKILPEYDDIVIQKRHINHDYEHVTTTCRFKKNAVIPIIQKQRDVAKISLLYTVVFESITNCDIIAEIELKTATEFRPTNDKKKDAILMENFFYQLYLDIEAFLRNEVNIPAGMIQPVFPLLSSYDIEVLTDTVCAELVKQGFYS